jgi:hypothetical protein
MTVMTSHAPGMELDAVALGRPVVVVDTKGEGALVVTAELVTAATMAPGARPVRPRAGLVMINVGDLVAHRRRYTG